MMLSSESRPVLRRGIRRHFDAARGSNILQGPERVIVLDEIASAITELCDAQHSVAEISIILAERFQGEPAQVQADVLEFLAELNEKGLVGV